MENNDTPMFKLKNIDKVNLEKNSTTSNIIAEAENVKEFIAKKNTTTSNGRESKDLSIIRKIYKFILKNSWAVCIAVVTAIIAAYIKGALHIS